MMPSEGVGVVARQGRCQAQHFVCMVVPSARNNSGGPALALATSSSKTSAARARPSTTSPLLQVTVARDALSLLVEGVRSQVQQPTHAVLSLYMLHTGGPGVGRERFDGAPVHGLPPWAEKWRVRLARPYRS